MTRTITERFDAEHQSELVIEATIYDEVDRMHSILSIGENPSVIVDEYELTDPGEDTLGAIEFTYANDIIGAFLTFDEAEYSRLCEWLEEYDK